jgi:hypothetical protein
MRATETNPLPFRVTFSDGKKLDVTAGSPEQARNAAVKRRRLAEPESKAFVTKTKLLRAVGAV